MNFSVRSLRFLVLLMALLASRAFFVDQMLIGEEGSFAALVVASPRSSAVTPDGMPQMNIGTIGDRPLYEPFKHNITPYILLEHVGGAIVHAVLPVGQIDPQRLTVTVRATYFAFFLVGVVGLLWFAARTWIGAATALFALSAPLVVGASIQPQIDGSTGVLLVGTAGLLLMGEWRSKVLAMLLAGVAIGFGRHELTIAFGAAFIATVLLCRLFGLSSIGRLGPFAVGLAFGAVTAYLISPADYVAALGTMGRVYDLPTSRFATLSAQWPQVWPVWALMVCANALVLWNLRNLLERRPEAVLLVLGGSAVALGFAVSGWSGDGLPRYFVPAAIAFAYVLVVCEKVSALYRPLVATALAALLATTVINGKELYDSRAAGVSITSNPGLSITGLRANFARSAERARSNHSIVLEQASLWIYHPGVDFISTDMGVDGARKYLQDHFPGEAVRFAPE